MNESKINKIDVNLGKIKSRERWKKERKKERKKE
jgi:hypothetical protein